MKLDYIGEQNALSKIHAYSSQDLERELYIFGFQGHKVLFFHPTYKADSDGE